MFNYIGTEKFDVEGFIDKFEFDFFNVDNEGDFRALIDHYISIFHQFKYYPDVYKTTDYNHLNISVQEKMKKQNANACLTFLKKDILNENCKIKKLLINRKLQSNKYRVYILNFYYFAINRADECYKEGLAYAKENLHNAAIRYFSDSIKLSPNTALTYYNRGLSYIERKKYDKAIKDFTQVLKLGLNIMEPYGYRGVSYFERKKYDAAIKDFTQAIRPSPKEAHLFSILGLSYKKYGNNEKAKINFEKALELDPKNEMASECLEKINKEQTKE